MPWVYPRLIGKCKEGVDNTFVERVELRLRESSPDASGEETVSGKQMAMPGWIVIEQADRALSVTGEFEDAKGDLAERDGRAARNREGGSDGELTGIQLACNGPCSGGGHDVG